MPTKGQVRVDEALTNLTIQFFNDRQGFIGEQMSPVIDVSKSTGVYYTYQSDVRMRLQDDTRRPRTRFKRIDWSVSTQAFKTEDHGLEQAIDDEERDDADSALELDMDANEALDDQVSLNWEKETATLLTTAANYPTGHKTTLAGASQWSDYDGSDPFSDIDTAMEAILTATGRMPNKIGMGYQVWRVLRRHPDLLARVDARDTAELSLQDVARLFEVDEILVGRAVYNTANEGATLSNSFIWGKHVVIAYVAPRPSKKTASLTYQFMKQRPRTVRYREEQIKSDVIRVERNSVSKIIAGQCGYLFTNAVA